MSEQMSPEGNGFRWYEHSQLDGSLRPLTEFCIDKYVYNDHTELMNCYTCKL